MTQHYLERGVFNTDPAQCGTQFVFLFAAIWSQRCANLFVHTCAGSTHVPWQHPGCVNGRGQAYQQLFQSGKGGGREHVFSSSAFSSAFSSDRLAAAILMGSPTAWHSIEPSSRPVSSTTPHWLAPPCIYCSEVLGPGFTREVAVGLSEAPKMLRVKTVLISGTKSQQRYGRASAHHICFFKRNLGSYPSFRFFFVAFIIFDNHYRFLRNIQISFCSASFGQVTSHIVLLIHVDRYTHIHVYVYIFLCVSETVWAKQQVLRAWVNIFSAKEIRICRCAPKKHVDFQNLIVNVVSGSSQETRCFRSSGAEKSL